MELTPSINDKVRLTLIDKIVLAIIFMRFCYLTNYFLPGIVGYIAYYTLYLVFIFLSFLGNSISIKNWMKDLWILFAFLIMIIFRSLYANNTGINFSDPMKVTIMLSNMIVAYSLYLYIRDRSNFFQRKVLQVSMLAISITILVSIYFVSYVDYLAVRNARKINLGVGDFDFIYCIVFLAIVCIAILRSHSTSKNMKFKIMFLYLLTLVLIIKANFMTALLLFLIASISAFILNHNMKTVHRFILLIGSCMIGVFFITFKVDIGNVLILVSNKDIFSWVINEKIIAIGNQLLGFNSDLDTWGVRIEKIRYTIESFISNPLFGLNYADYNATTIGGHAQWFDDLARFGIVGMIFMSFFYVNIYRSTIKKIEDEVSKNATQLGWLLFIILGFLNPNTMATVTMILFIVVPFAGSLVNETRASL